MPGVYEAAANEIWAIEPGMLETILAIASRTNPAEPEAIAAKLGRQLDNTRAVSVRDGVAVVPISGPLFRYANLFTMVSGATSMEMLAKDINKAVEDPQVRAILLEVDSPGGMVNGVADLASQIMAARAVKPVWAYVSNQGESAGYWLASAASRVVVSPTAQVGSIGVVASAAGSKPGDDIQFVSNISPRKRPDLRSASGLAQVQAQIDALGQVFAEAVAKQRGISVDKVLADFGQGDSFVGAAAVAAGLADSVGTFEQTIAELAQATGLKPQGGLRMPRTYLDALAAGEVLNITAGELKARHPEIVQAMQAEGREGLITTAQAQEQSANALTAERERIGALALAMLGEEAGKRFQAAVASGLPAEQLQAMGVSLAPAADAKKQEILDGLHKAFGDKGPNAGAGVETPAEHKAEDWPALVEAHQAQHKCDKAEAMKAVDKSHPGLREEYLKAVNAKGQK